MEKFKVFQIDAWEDPEGVWTYNDKFECFDFKSDFEEIEENFEKALNYNGVTWDENKFEIRDVYGTGEVFELVCIEDDCPMYSAELVYDI